MNGNADVQKRVNDDKVGHVAFSTLTCEHEAPSTKRGNLQEKENPTLCEMVLDPGMTKTCFSARSDVIGERLVGELTRKRLSVQKQKMYHAVIKYLKSGHYLITQPSILTQ